MTKEEKRAIRLDAWRRKDTQKFLKDKNDKSYESIKRISVEIDAVFYGHKKIFIDKYI